MKFSEVKLPSNEKFGFFFVLVFAITAGYFFIISHLTWFYIFTFNSLLFLTVSIFKPGALLPFNKLWMRFGILLGMLVSPIIIGIIFFGLFTPVSMLMRISGRDELRLKIQEKNTYWISRTVKIEPASFKNQF